MQLGRAASDAKRQPGNRFAVSIGQPRDGALSDALAKGGNYLDLFFVAEVVHEGAILWLGDGPRRDSGYSALQGVYPRVLYRPAGPIVLQGPSCRSWGKRGLRSSVQACGGFLPWDGTFKATTPKKQKGPLTLPSSSS